MDKISIQIFTLRMIFRSYHQTVKFLRRKNESNGIEGLGKELVWMFYKSLLNHFINEAPHPSREIKFLLSLFLFHVDLHAGNA